MRCLTRLSLAFILVLPAAGVAASAESKIEFDKPKDKGKKNPSSPEPGTITATGTYELAGGDTLTEIRLEYRPKGQPVWRFAAAEVDRDKRTWKKTVSKLPPGQYEVRVFMGLEGKRGEAAIWNPDGPKHPPHVVEVK